jgi:hypothetical protein
MLEVVFLVFNAFAIVILIKPLQEKSFVKYRFLLFVLIVVNSTEEFE